MKLATHQRFSALHTKRFYCCCMVCRDISFAVYFCVFCRSRFQWNRGRL